MARDNGGGGEVVCQGKTMDNLRPNAYSQQEGCSVTLRRETKHAECLIYSLWLWLIRYEPACGGSICIWPWLRWKDDEVEDQVVKLVVAIACN